MQVEILIFQLWFEYFAAWILANRKIHEDVMHLNVSGFTITVIFLKKSRINQS